MAVEYYMDPRNFLNEEGIFQFEKLSFTDAVTIADVENVLKGTFMAEGKITYYTAEGEQKKSSKTYAQVIYEAGQEYDVNPCYLASKIRNEVGADGSASVSGTHSTYPGIYNFYNIGATDGTGAITRGLEWASGGTTYKRPWTTPAKSIKGGAAYIVEKYIARGQFTGYLQKFNVNKASGSLYTHQYMTNLPGAAAPAYQTYKTYLENDLINNKFIFVIPIYNNMPSHNITSGSVYSVDGFNQTGKINTDCYVRKGPSVDSQLAGIQLTSGTEVTILETVETDTKVTDNIMRYPYWCKIKFTHNGKSKTGYVYSNFITLITQTLVGAGSYVPPSFSTSPE